MTQQSRWYELDNAAKIVPPTTKGSDTRVFRISCELKEEVDGEILQRALDKTVPDFPYFACVLRRGLFWYYLDSSSIRAVVQPENKPACAPIYQDGRRKLLYRVNYHRRRINLEMFHVLTDGTGAIAFLKTIVCRYLQIRHDIEYLEREERSSAKDKTADAFNRYYEQDKKGTPREQQTLPRKAYHLQGERDDNLQSHLIEGTVSAKRFLKVTKEHGATAAAFSTALFMEAILEEMSVREKKLPIVLSVPVNLRNYYPSETARNFFGVINVAFDPSDYDGTLDSILHVVQDSFKRQLEEEQVALTMNGYSRLEHNIMIKAVPLVLKNLVIGWVNAAMQKGITGTVSNVGKVTLPEPFVPYVDRFSCFMAAPDVQICVSSFGDRMCFGIASPFEAHPVMMRFFRKMVALGIDVEIATNDSWADEEKPVTEWITEKLELGRKDDAESEAVHKKTVQSEPAQSEPAQKDTVQSEDTAQGEDVQEGGR